MNLVKAADDLKNLSDQQLMAAGQNPVAIPPYLVLAEMKRREQLRASFAKAQQQQQPPVIQQVAQNLAQGQPQQPQQPQPQGQGIMQAMPQGAVGMAGGGHVARYADKGRVTAPTQLAIDPFVADLMKKQSDIYASMLSAPAPQSTARPDLVLSQADIERQYKGKSPLELMSQAESLYGKGDYSAYENFLRGQMEEAKSRKVRLGDALIAAGAAMASNRDPRVGLASVLAQGLGAGAQSYRQAEEQKKKDIQTAMLAQVALDKMKREEQQQRAGLAMNLAQMDSGKLLTMLQTLEANKRSMNEDLQSETRESRQRELQIKLAQISAIQNQINNALQHQNRMSEIGAQLAGQKDIARISAGARGLGSSDPRVIKLNALKSQDASLRGKLNILNDQMKSLPPGRRGEADRAKLREQISSTTIQLSNLQDAIANLAGIEAIDPLVGQD